MAEDSEGLGGVSLGSGLTDFCSKSGEITERVYGDNWKLRLVPLTLMFYVTLSKSFLPLQSQTRHLGFITQLSRITCSLGQVMCCDSFAGTFSFNTLTEAMGEGRLSALFYR